MRLIEVALKFIELDLDQSVRRSFKNSKESQDIFSMYINTQGFSIYGSLSSVSNDSKEKSNLLSFYFRKILSIEYLDKDNNHRDIQLSTDQIQDIKDNFFEDGKLKEIEFTLAYGRIDSGITDESLDYFEEFIYQFQ